MLKIDLKIKADGDTEQKIVTEGLLSVIAPQLLKQIPSTSSPPASFPTPTPPPDLPPPLSVRQIQSHRLPALSPNSPLLQPSAIKPIPHASNNLLAQQTAVSAPLEIAKPRPRPVPAPRIPTRGHRLRTAIAYRLGQCAIAPLNFCTWAWANHPAMTVGLMLSWASLSAYLIFKPFLASVDAPAKTEQAAPADSITNPDRVPVPPPTPDPADGMVKPPAKLPPLPPNYKPGILSPKD